MQKFTYVLFILLLLSLGGCSDGSAPEMSEKQLIAQLKHNNALLLDNEIEGVTFNYPFSQPYLKTRHDTYQLLKNSDTNNYPTEMLDYLIIEERFAERFFMWPPTASIVLNWLNLNEKKNNKEHLDIKGLDSWINTVFTTLKGRYSEQLVLDKINLHYLTSQVSQSITALNQAFIKPSVNEAALIASLERLNEYLGDYRARNSLALSQQPNGASWYQAKLNYYGTAVNSPAQWLNETNDVITKLGISELNKEDLDISLLNDRQLSNNWFLGLYPVTTILDGLDWRHSYIDVVSSLASINGQQVTNDMRFIAALLAQIDLGIHYQAWTQQHARNVLKTHLNLSDSQADRIIDYSVLYPAVLLSPFAQLNKFNP